VARGFLCGDLRDVGTLAANDIRRAMPRFSADTYAANLPMLDAYQAIALEVGCTPAQLALAWLLHKDSKLIPIPGTQNIHHLEDNIAAADVVLSAEQMQRLEALINQHTVKGPRYNALNASEVDTEEFA
jgi:aryl-alcohol dehydrogenase-like predicted oxidoreductase